MILFISLMTSCSEDVNMEMRNDSGYIQVTAEIPQAMSDSRAPITIGSDNQLRCIIEMWTHGEESELAYRSESLVPAGQTPKFDFQLKSGDYDCMLWADFVKKDAPSEDINSDGITYKHYEDTYYNTLDLKNINIKDPSASNMFDTDNCDAYFSRKLIEKSEGETFTLNLTMERPMAKIVVKEQESDKISVLKHLKVSYEIPAGFNVFTGEPTSKTITAILDKEYNFDNVSTELFTGYVFAPSMEEKELGTISLGISTPTNHNREIPEGSITIKRNQCTKIFGKIIEGDGNVDPDPEPEEMKVGDFFFSDGTWGNELKASNKEKCVGIVYAVGAQPGDEISFYGKAGIDKTIRGYAVSLKYLTATFEVTEDNGCGTSSQKLYIYNKVMNPSPFQTWPKDEDVENNQFNNDIVNNDGYRKTQILLNEFDSKAGNTNDVLYPFMQCFHDWLNVQQPINNASTWYIPSARQFLVIGGTANGLMVSELEGNDLSQFVTEDIAVNEIFRESLSKAKSEGIAEGVLTRGASIVGNSSLSNSGDGPTPIHLEVNKNKFNRIKEGNGNKTFVIRPVLTIFK